MKRGVMHTGKVVHFAVPVRIVEGYQLSRPLCGMGRRSLAYLAETEKEATCSKCIARKAALDARKGS